MVVPTHNRLDFLRQALKSVDEQTLSDYETIVVDDGSDDGTAAYLASLGERINALYQRHKGPGAARNLGARQASGSYLVFLDSDDLWLPWTLATFHMLVQQHAPSFLFGSVVEFTDYLPILGEEPVRATPFKDYFSTSAEQPEFVGSGALVVKKNEFERVGGFDESLNVVEDHDLLFRLGTAPGVLRIQSPITLMYRRHGSNTARLLSEMCTCAATILTKEIEGLYPGGAERQKERWELLTRMLRPIALASLKAGHDDQAWHLYRRSFAMNARLRRLRFLAGFPVIATLRH